ncbi:MAG: MobA/MobL family protein [Oscillospiraceae bacterium]|nr:MobA/MobL family protein [Oscillospiraceae bacterium]
MAIYHLEAKIISRGEGRSAVAAAAYMSCDKIYNDYDGIQHDYTKKQGLVWEHVFLPQYAPPEWKDRAKLWNAVEESEKTKDSRLAREFVVALPVELKKVEWVRLLSEFIEDNFVSDGMCADVAVHDTDGHNPHAHIMLTVRPLDKNGKWQHKTEKEYICIRNGMEQGFTAFEFKEAQSDGWEKQYQYKVGRKKIYMSPSVAEAHGYERVSKYPKSTKYGRQNPVVERWNSDEQLVLWRKAWADINNKYLSRAGVDETIDHRSHADRGIDEQPTVHEGVTARVLELNGIISERCELNRQIKADNLLLHKLKETVKKLMQAVRNTIPTIAEAMENIRQKVTISCYQLRLIRLGQKKYTDYILETNSEIEKYNEIEDKIYDAVKERETLIAEKKNTLFFNFSKHKTLDTKIAELTELLEKLNSEKTALLEYLDCADNDGISKVKKYIFDTETGLKKFNEQEKTYSEKIDTALMKYAELREQGAEFDSQELYEVRQAIRPAKEQLAEQQLRKAYGEKYSAASMLKCRQEASRLLNDEAEKRSVMEKVSPYQKNVIEQRKKKKKCGRSR